MVKVTWITRAAYNRKAYHRKGYVRKSGIRVKSSNVRAAHVKRGRIHSRYGRPKTPMRKRVLPKLIKGDLKGYNYRVKAPTSQRRVSIKRMMEHKGALKTLRTLVVLRSYNKRSKLYKRLDADVKFAQKLYKKMPGARGHHRRTGGKAGKRPVSKKPRRTMAQRRC
jgi:hypothetical protein